MSHGTVSPHSQGAMGPSLLSRHPAPMAQVVAVVHRRHTGSDIVGHDGDPVIARRPSFTISPALPRRSQRPGAASQPIRAPLSQEGDDDLFPREHKLIGVHVATRMWARVIECISRWGGAEP